MFQLIRIGTTRVIMMWAALSAGCLPFDRMGNLSASRILEIAAQVDGIDQGIQSTSGVDFGLETHSHSSATEKLAGSRLSARPINCVPVAISVRSLKMLQAAAARLCSISGAGKRQPRSVESAFPLIKLRET